ncbi:unnamed protein product [Brachionus calyciflorus]|uniref:Transcription initiation factor IIA subunit 2 n=1 Tax=Brachionus calyciflorus TaxID=104777 RepID=A0A813NMS3_9BILA|nr:unnamed protein product [Brachionus calyciflorus]
MSNEYEVYRTISLGTALQETLDEFVQSNQIKDKMAKRIFQQYDRSISKVFQSQIKNKVHFKSKLDIYRNCDNVWTLLFNGIEITFTDQQNQSIKLGQENKVKIVACEAKSDKKSKYNNNFDD